MNKPTCEVCGSTEIVKQDGVFVCQDCGCKYSVEDVKNRMNEEKNVMPVEPFSPPENFEEPVMPSSVVAYNAEALLKRANMFLEDGEWRSAAEYCEKVLDIEPENGDAYLGKLMAEVHAHRQEELENSARPFGESNAYKKAVRFGDEDRVAFLTECSEKVSRRVEQENLQAYYASAIQMLDMAASEDACFQAETMFRSISGYEQADAYAQKCVEKADFFHKEYIYIEACRLMNATRGPGVQPAVVLAQAEEMFRSIPDYRDANFKMDQCRRLIFELNENERRAQLRKEAKRIQGHIRRKRAKKVLITFLIIVLVLVLGAVAVWAAYFPLRYSKANKLEEEGKYEEAYALFSKLEYPTVLFPEGEYYSNSRDRARKVKSSLDVEKLAEAEVGDVVEFGMYEQDNNKKNGPEPIEWRVVKETDGVLILLSEKALDCQPYEKDIINDYDSYYDDYDDHAVYKSVSWSSCSLRNWLNSSFYSDAFISNDKKQLVQMNGDRVAVPAENVMSTPNTSYYEYRECEPTPYAVVEGAFKDGKNGPCIWWTSTPGKSTGSALAVNEDGKVQSNGYWANSDAIAVRPVIYVEIDD